MEERLPHVSGLSLACALLISGAAGCKESVDVGVLPAADADADALADAFDAVPNDDTLGADTTDSALDAPTSDGADGSPDGSGDAGPGALTEAFGSSGRVFLADLAVDRKTGDVLATGWLESSASVDFGGGPMTAGSAYSTAFLARFDATGHHLWSKLYSSGSHAMGSRVAVDSSGDLYFAGSFGQSVSINLGCGPLKAKADDIFVARLDASGACRWAKSFGEPFRSQSVLSLGVDPKGGFVLHGTTTEIDFGGGSLASGMYVAAFDGAGAHRWSRIYSNDAASINHSTVVVDGEGRVVVAGDFWGKTDFGNGPISTAGANPDAFAFRLGTTGAIDWFKRWPHGDVAVTGLAIDGSNAPFLVGRYVGKPIDFGLGPLAAADPSTVYGFLVKLDPTGTAAWAKPFESGAPACPTAGACGIAAARVTIGVDGAPIVIAVLRGGSAAWVDFGGGHLASSGAALGPPWDMTTGQGSAVAAFDLAGAHRWSVSTGPTSTADYASAVAVSATATRVIVGGDFGVQEYGAKKAPAGTTLVLGGSKVTAVGAGSVFVLHLPL